MLRQIENRATARRANSRILRFPDIRKSWTVARTTGGGTEETVIAYSACSRRLLKYLNTGFEAKQSTMKVSTATRDQSCADFEKSSDSERRPVPSTEPKMETRPTIFGRGVEAIRAPLV
jgi:hypothetical protein